MKKISTKLSTAIKVIGGVMCLGLFMFNIMSTVASSSCSLSFTSLKAYADDGDIGGEEEAQNIYQLTVVSGYEDSVRYTPTQKCTKTRFCFAYECPPGGTDMCTPIARQCGDYGPETCVTR